MSTGPKKEYALLSAAPVTDCDNQIFDFAALEATPLRREPFDFFVVPGFLAPRALAAANQDFPLINDPGNYPWERLKYGPGFGQVLDALQSIEFAEKLGRKFGVELAGCPMTITVRKFCEASDGNIHTDHRSKIITSLLYFNPEWDHEGGKLRMLRSKSDIEDYAAEVVPVNGTFLAFRRTNRSFHGHKRFIGERRILQISWLKPSKQAQCRLKFDRISTSLMKRLSRST